MASSCPQKVLSGKTFQGRAGDLHRKPDTSTKALHTGVAAAAGLPTLVARRSMQNTAGLVGRTVSSATEAVTAAADGVNVVLIEVRDLPLFCTCQRPDAACMCIDLVAFKLHAYVLLLRTWLSD